MKVQLPRKLKENRTLKITLLLCEEILLVIAFLMQGPKLTVLCRRQVATEIFFSVAKWKNLVAKKWFVKFLLHSETRKHQLSFKNIPARLACIKALNYHAAYIALLV